MFTTGSGTWKVPKGITSVTVEIWGGGGGGGSSNDGGGGGGGGYAKAVITTSPGTEFNYKVGEGGSAGPQAKAGGQTTIGGPATITADSGLPGSDGDTQRISGGAGGATSGGTEQNLTWSTGTDGTLLSSSVPRGAPAILGGGGNGGDAACFSCAIKANPTAGTAGHVKFSW